MLKHDGSVDIESSIKAYTGNRARQGFTEKYKLKASNPGVAVSGPLTLTLTFPNTVTFVSSIPSYNSSSANVYTYTIQNIGERKELEFELEFKIDLSQNPIGSYIQFISNVTSLSGDVNINNNVDTIDLKVVAACDPNDKTPSLEKSLQGLAVLDYHIRFQNTGTDTAYKVVIVDTLESYLKVNELQLNDASHSYDFKVTDGNVLVWTFENILLPDSGTNILGSQGYVDFTIGVDNTLPIGSIIDNDAEIYFDYQKPVHTNHAKTAIVKWISLPETTESKSLVNIYPNPSSEVINLDNTSEEPIYFKLFNSNGVLVKEFSVAPNHQETIDVTTMKTGFYLLTSETLRYKILIE